VGPNGAGKSNIFEALEFFVVNHDYRIQDRIRLFGGKEALKHRGKKKLNDGYFHAVSDTFDEEMSFSFETGKEQKKKELSAQQMDFLFEMGLIGYHELVSAASRLFIKNIENQKVNFDDYEKLNFSASNLEKVLKRLLEDGELKEEITEWLALFIPGFEDILVVSSELSGTDTLLMFEKGIEKPFTKDLLSDGTYNILALLTAVYQSNEPQFLCIEEPENGLHPEVIKELVGFFRAQCEEKGHYIWLNTHSQTLVSQLQPEEIILVNKRQGATQVKQLKGKDLHGLTMDEAWLSNALGGGLTW
jgi:predicted ATPase